MPFSLQIQVLPDLVFVERETQLKYSQVCLSTVNQRDEAFLTVVHPTSYPINILKYVFGKDVVHPVLAQHQSSWNN